MMRGRFHFLITALVLSPIFLITQYVYAQYTGLGTTSPAAAFHIYTVPTWIDSVVLIQRGNQTYWILSPAGRLGIGVVSPAYTLDVADSIRILDLSSVNGGVVRADANGFLYSVPATGSPSDMLRGDLTWGPPAGGGSLWLYSGGNTFPTTLVPSASFAITDSGWVGIGTGNPQAPLHVAGHIWQSAMGNSTFIGVAAGENDLFSNNQNVFIGDSAGFNNWSGYNNVALGALSMFFTSDDSFNVAVGYYSHAASGSENVALGAYSMAGTTVNRSVAVGSSTLMFCNPCSENIAIGDRALWTVSNGNYNVAIGDNALSSLDVGGPHIAIGYDALSLYQFALFSSTPQIAIGDSALALVNGTPGNVAIGTHALARSTDGYYNTAVGYHAIKGQTTGARYNTAVGFRVISAPGTNALHNTAVGFQALKDNTAGSQNVALGARALQSNTSGYNNIALGYRALQSNTSGIDNIAIGADALSSNTTSSRNVAIGDSALATLSSGEQNIVIGRNSLSALSTGSYNISIGFEAGKGLISANRNILMGSKIFTNQTNRDINDNVVLGYQLENDTGDIARSVFIKTGSYNSDTVQGKDRVLISNLLGFGWNSAFGFKDSSTVLIMGPISSQDTEVVKIMALSSEQDGQLSVSIGYNTGLWAEDPVSTAELGKGNRLVAIGANAPLMANNTRMENGVLIGNRIRISGPIGAIRFVAEGSIIIGQRAWSDNNAEPRGVYSPRRLSNMGSIIIGYKANRTKLSPVPSDSSSHTNIVVGREAKGNFGLDRYNIAIGTKAMSYVAASPDSVSVDTGYRLRCIAIGYHAMDSVAKCFSSVAVGKYAMGGQRGLPLNGNFQFALGNYALYESDSNAYNKWNIAIGNSALKKVKGASGNNIAIGQNAMDAHVFNSQELLAIGWEALGGDTVSAANSQCIGARCGKALKFAGEGNIYVGNFIRYDNTASFLDSFNTAVGAGSGPALSLTTAYNTGALGNQAQPTASNRIHIGNTSVNWIGGQVNWGTYSDRRLKANVSENVPGLEFITRLRPVTYQFDIEQEYRLLYGSEDTTQWADKYDIEHIRFSGFLAQDVEQASKAIGYSFGGLRTPHGIGGDGRSYSLSYEMFVAPMVKAIQEQQQIIAQQEERLKEQQERIAQLQKRIAERQKRIQQLQSMMQEKQETGIQMSQR